MHYHQSIDIWVKPGDELVITPHPTGTTPSVSLHHQDYVGGFGFSISFPPAQLPALRKLITGLEALQRRAARPPLTSCAYALSIRRSSCDRHHFAG